MLLLLFGDFFFIPSHVKSVRHYVIPSVQNLLLSVCPPICSSRSLSGAFLLPLFFKFCVRVYIVDEWLGIIDG